MNLEEIVKFQQELLNQQRSQKAIQKETMKLVSLLNKNITFMSERLDEFALKANLQINEKEFQNTLKNTAFLLNSSLDLLDVFKATTSNTDSDASEFHENDSEDEKETIQIKKKPKVNETKDKETEESNNQQRLFNKFVRESVESRLGKEFLLLHEIQEIDPEIMETIKKEALRVYPPINMRPRRAWHLAKASLRCRRRSLKRQREKSNSLNNNTNANLNTSNSSSNQVTANIMDDY